MTANDTSNRQGGKILLKRPEGNPASRRKIWDQKLGCLKNEVVLQAIFPQLEVLIRKASRHNPLKTTTKLSKGKTK